MKLLSASVSSLTLRTVIFIFLFIGLTQSLPDNVGDGSSFQIKYVWALITAFHLSFTFGFAMGSNEVSNAFATSVGSGAIKLRTAYILATIIESAGAILLGYKVLQTLRFEVIDLEMYVEAPHELLLGQIAILGATFCALPVSSTHSHIGSIIGFSMVMRGPKGLHLNKVFLIMASWIVSPALSGLVSAILYIIFDIAVFRRRDSLKCGLRAMPIFYFCVFYFNTFMVVYHGSKWIGLDTTPFWLALLISLGVASLASMSFQFIFRPFILKWVRRGDSSEEKNGAPRLTPANGAFTSLETSFAHNAVTIGDPDLGLRRFWFLPNRTRRDDPKTLRLFSAIQVFTGCFTGFSHGSKDIPNTIAPLATLIAVFSTAKVPSPGETPLWILCYGSFAACIGFWMLGHRVIKTVGKEFTEINSFCGFTVELGAAITVLCAAKIGIPVSMTICIVGSIVAVGAVRGSVPVNWQLFRKAFLAWICTFPLSGVFSGCIMFGLKYFFLSK
uniref:Phosphate transporter n=1 Tax=Meloidogyne incognita TaxID=6306 RepID=A0A914LWS4_MELIC